MGPTVVFSASSRSIRSRWRDFAASAFRTPSSSSAQRVFTAVRRRKKLAPAGEARLGDAAPPEEQERIRLAKADVEMARYYEDARRLAFLITQWTKSINQPRHRFVICTGGGPGIMEAANLGASEAGGKTIGMNIDLPFEQMPNPYITPDLNFEFHYFFMRKLWFAYLSKALVVFPGGFGTFDELFELLTLAQTEKLAKRICVVIYGKDYWDRVINFQAFVDAGTISPKDLELFHWANTPEEAFEYLRKDLSKHHLEPQPTADKEPDILKTRP